MPLPLDVTMEDFASFTYNRKVHLIILVAMCVMSLVVNTLTFLVNDTATQFWGLLLGALYLLFWWLRGLEKCAGLFPALHYISLFVEYVFHCLATLGIMFMFLMLLFVLMGNFELIIIVLVILMVVLLAFYAYIVFKLTPFVITVLRGSPAEKEALGCEIRGLGAGIPPGGPSGAGLSQPLPVQVQTG